MGTDWASLTVVKLRDELKNLDLPTKGVKSELISRLEEWETAHPGSEFRPVESQKEDSPPSASHLPATPAKGGLVGRRSSLRIAKTPARGRAASKLKDAITDKTTTDDDENEAEIDTGTQSGATPDKEEEAIEPASLLPMTPATKGRRSTTRSTKKPPAENLTNKTTIDEDENEAEVDTSTPSDATPDKEEEAIEPASLLPMTPATKGRRATTRSTKKPPADDIPDKITTDDDEKEPEVDPGTQSGATPEKEEDAVEPASLLPMTPATKGRRATTRSTKKPPAETIVEETANGNEQQAAEPAATPANGAGRRKSTRTVTNTLAARTGHKLSQDISDETKVAEADVSGKPKASTKTSAADTASEEIETDQNTPPQSTDNQKRKKDEGTVDVASKKNKTTGSKTVGESAGVMAKPASQAGVSEDKSVPAPVAPTAAKPAAVKEKMSVDVPKAPFKEIEKPVLADKETLSAGQISGKSGDATPRSALSFTDQPTGGEKG
ncbi:hypothetical protein DFJ77DRAFT_63310 [Powellomyces hirtus]|nr:hypothetical protein DFJ77DRAFT_63310 [Powellomyces hirtus]